MSAAESLDFITEQDIDTLGKMARASQPRSTVETDRLEDPADSDPERTGKTLSRLQSRALVELSEKRTNAEAAARCGVSQRTVERHRAHWLGFDDQGAVTLQFTTVVDDRLCAAMRAACHDGETIGDVAEYFDVSRGAVYNHVSASYRGECSHDPPVELDRVEFHYGGELGSPDRMNCPQCGKFTTEGGCCA